jgi:hypothetical protein
MLQVVELERKYFPSHMIENSLKAWHELDKSYDYFGLEENLMLP